MLKKVFYLSWILLFLCIASTCKAAPKTALPVKSGCLYSILNPSGKFRHAYVLEFNKKHTGAPLAACNTEKMPELTKPEYFRYSYLGYARPYYYVSYIYGHRGYGFEQEGGALALFIKKAVSL